MEKEHTLKPKEQSNKGVIIKTEREIKDIIDSEDYKNEITNITLEIYKLYNTNERNTLIEGKITHMLAEAIVTFGEKGYPIDDILKIIEDKEVDDLLTPILQQASNNLSNKNIIITQKGIDALLNKRINKDGFIYIKVLINDMFKYNYDIIKQIVSRIKSGNNMSETIFSSIIGVLVSYHADKLKKDDELIEQIIRIVIIPNNVSVMVGRTNALLIEIGKMEDEVILIDIMNRIVDKLNKIRKTKQE